MENQSDRAGEAWFKAFYEKNARPLWFYIFKVCGDESLADDIFQEAFCRFLAVRKKGLTESHGKSYLYKIAYNLFIDRMRRGAVERRALGMQRKDLAEQTGASTGGGNILLSLEMEQTFRKLKPKERNLLWLAYVEGYSYDEVAAIVKTRVNVVRMQLFRARRRLAGLLKQKSPKGEDGS